MSMVTATLRPSRVEINETAIAHNVQHAIAGLPDQTALFAVVKADAYGHGLLRVARIAQAAGASGFCVAVLDEALALRRFLTDDDPALAALIAGYVKMGALNAQIANEFTVCESEALTESW